MRYVKMLAALLLTTTLVGSTLAAEDQVPWAPNLDAAVQMASRQNRLVLIHFWGNACAPCVKLEQNVFTRPEVGQAIGQTFVPVKINAHELPATAAKYGVDRWPTDVIITPAGYMIAKVGCPQNAEQYVGQLTQIATQTKSGVQAAGQLANSAAQATGAAQAAIGNFAGNFQSGQPALTNQQGAPLAGGASNFSQFASAPTTGNPATAPLNQTHSNPTSNFSQGSPFAAATNQLATGGSRFSQGQPPQMPSQYNANRFSDPLQAALPPQNAPVGPQFGNQVANSPSEGRVQLYGQQNELAGSAPPNAGFHGEASPPTTAQAPAAQPEMVANPMNASIGMPNQFAQRPPHQGSLAPQGAAGGIVLPPGSPPLCMEGYCPVTLTKNASWQKGDVRWGAIHRGRTYLFLGQQQQQTFLQDPDQFSPVLSGHDPVVYAQSGQLVSGRREHGVFYQKSVYLFADEKSLTSFWTAPENYANVVHQAMQQQPAYSNNQTR